MDRKTRSNIDGRQARATLIAACLALLVFAAPAGAEAAEEDSTATAAASPAPTASKSGGARLLDARVKPKRAYSFGLKQPRFWITLGASGPTDIRIDIVRAKSGLLQRSITVDDVKPRTATAVGWDGRSSSGAPVRGKLRFVVRGPSGKPLRFSKRYLRAAGGKKKKKGKKRTQFGFFDFIFPVRGKHSYGDGIGAPRGDHTHQGQDISARCGTKLVAAQGGTVTVNAYQASGAGFYLVIDTIGGTDMVYMHMAYRSAIPVGTVVRTGQTIGSVGTTGSSSGCHLHFEMWTPPGWYSGGTFANPSPYLRAWDKYS